MNNSIYITYTINGATILCRMPMNAAEVQRVIAAGSLGIYKADTEIGGLNVQTNDKTPQCQLQEGDVIICMDTGKADPSDLEMATVKFTIRKVVA